MDDVVLALGALLARVEVRIGVTDVTGVDRTIAGLELAIGKMEVLSGCDWAWEWVFV